MYTAPKELVFQPAANVSARSVSSQQLETFFSEYNDYRNYLLSISPASDMESILRAQIALDRFLTGDSAGLFLPGVYNDLKLLTSSYSTDLENDVYQTLADEIFLLSIYPDIGGMIEYCNQALAGIYNPRQRDLYSSLQHLLVTVRDRF